MTDRYPTYTGPTYTGSSYQPSPGWAAPYPDARTPAAGPYPSTHEPGPPQRPLAPYPGFPAGAQPGPLDYDRSSASMAHWLAILVGWVGPLILMLTKGERDPYVKHHARQSLNISLTTMIINLVWAVGYGIVYGVVVVVSLGIAALPMLLGFFLPSIYGLVMHLQGAAAASRGDATYRPGLAIRFLR